MQKKVTSDEWVEISREIANSLEEELDRIIIDYGVIASALEQAEKEFEETQT